MNATLSIQKITPKRAQELLQDIFEGQRHVRQRYVDRLACEMNENRWHLSPDCVLMVKGKLANGQHRLHAVIKSKLAQPFIVMETADDELYKFIDAGIKRQVADVLMGAENRNLVAAAARWIVMYDKELITRLSAQHSSNKKDGTVMSRGEIVDYAQEHLESINGSVCFCLSLYRQKPLLSASQGGAIMHLASRNPRTYPEEKVKQFFASTYLGDSRDDSAWDLRERLIKNRTSNAKMPSPYMFGLVIKSLKSYIQGTRPGVLKIAEGEPFPKL